MKKVVSFLLMICLSFNLFATNINDILESQNNNIEQLEIEFNNVTIMVEELKNSNSLLKDDNEKLSAYVSVCEEKITSLKDNITSLKSALSSNKEDTSTVIVELGEMYDKVQSLEQYVLSAKSRLKNANVYVNILIPIATLPIIADGVYNINKGNKTYGKTLCTCGGIIFVSAEVTWNGGHLIFKWW